MAKGSSGVGNTTGSGVSETGKFARQGQTSGKFGNDPSFTGISSVGAAPKDAVTELKP